MGAVRPSRRTVGWIFLVGGLVGLIACLVGTIVAWFAMGTARRASVQGLEVTEEAIVAVRGSLELADDIVGSVQGSLDVVEDSLRQVAGTVGAADGVLAQVDELASALPSSIASARATIQSLTSVATVIDQTLAAASAVPFVPDYRPPRPLAEVVGQLDRDLAPIEDSLRQLDGQLDELAGPQGTVGPNLDALVERVAELNAQLDQAAAQVDDYVATANRAEQVTVDARDDLDRDLSLLRWLALPVGLSMCVTQFIPIWLGGGLLDMWPAPIIGRRAEPVLVRPLDSPTGPLAP